MGPLKITKEEFVDRYELVPQLTKSDQSLNKYNLLYSLIAEKLWALEAEHENLDTALISQTAYKRVEKMYVRDALYKIEIGSKAEATNKEINRGLKKYFSDLYVISMMDEDSNKIFNDYKMLKSGIPFDSLSKDHNLTVDTGVVKYGEIDANIENLFYRLKVGEYTEPFKAGNAWMIFKINDVKNRSYKSEDMRAVMQKVKKIIEGRKADIAYNNFMKKFFTDKQVKTDGEIFWQISDLLSGILSDRKTKQAIPDSQDISFEKEDFEKLESDLGNGMLHKTFIEFKKNPVTAEDFINQLYFDGFNSKQVDKNTISSKLHLRVKSFIEDELLSREGYKRGLQNLPKVQSKIEMWRQNYLAKLYQQRTVDSTKITDDEAYQYYLNKSKSGIENSPQVNILEILTDSLNVAEKVLDELKNGVDFKKLASIYTKRKWTRENGGEFGFFPTTMYGEIGKTAANMKIGDVYGPLKVDEGYSIIKLIGKKDAEKNITAPFDSVKDEMKKEALYHKLNGYFIKNTAALANKYGVTINNLIFNKLQLLDLRTYVFRNMGFGGRITAVPSTINFTQWVPVWESGRKVNP